MSCTLPKTTSEGGEAWVNIARVDGIVETSGRRMKNGGVEGERTMGRISFVVVAGCYRP